jgi:hypothetical protein
MRVFVGEISQMGKPATKECASCHHRFPVTEMITEVQEVESGRSGVSFSFNPARQKSGRINLGRRYYRKRQVWICEACNKKRSDGSAAAGCLVVFILIAVVIGLVIAFAK